jgi:sulfur-carrier protein
MARVIFTQQLRRFVEAPELDVKAGTVREALESVFALHPRLRGYLLDDQSHLRANVVVFVDGKRCHDRKALADPLTPYSRVHVLHALSGG